MKKIKVVWCILSIFLMALIFFFSHQTADVSSNTSGRFAKVLADVLALVFSGELYEKILWVAQWIVRKSAHLLLFTLLGVSVYNSFEIPRKGKRVLTSLIVCIFYAITDEFHQSFIPGRACRIGDVLIDSIGSMVGVFLAQVKSLCYILKKQEKGEDEYGN